MRFVTFTVVFLSWLSLLEAQSNVAATVSENPLTQYVTDDTVALLFAKPRSLITDTEQEILGDIPYLGQMPIPPSQIEQVAVLVQLPYDGEPTVVIGLHFHRDFPAATLMRWLASTPAVLDDAGQSSSAPADSISGFFGLPSHVAMPTPQTVIIAFDESVLEKCLQQTGPTAGTSNSLAQPFQGLDRSVNFAAMVNAGKLKNILDGVPPFVLIPGANEIRSLPDELSTMSLEAAFGKQHNRMKIRFSERADLPSSSSVDDWSTSAGATLQQFVETMAALLKPKFSEEIRREIDAQVAKVHNYHPNLDLVESNEGTTIQWQQAPSLSRALTQAVASLNLWVMTTRESARQMSLSNDLKQICLAWLGYETTHHELPQDIKDNNGKPLLSWRVRILPFLAQEALYNEFRLNEPWDSVHNRALLSRMPAVYHNPWNRDELSETRLQGVVGKDTALRGKTMFRDVTDGLSNTAFLVAASKPVPWTKPDDIPLCQNMVDALDFHGDTVPMAHLDGAVFHYPKLSDDVYQKLFEINDGEVLNNSELDNTPSNFNDAIHDSYLIELSDVPTVLTQLSSGNRDRVREAAMKLLVSKRRSLAISDRHRMSDVMLAWHNYHSAQGQFPLDIGTQDGKAVLSWRVRILPYLEQQELYDEFRLNEPWDSDHNKQLIAKMPAVYRDHESTLAAGETRLQVVTGKGTVFSDRVKLNAVLDGTSATSIMVEANDPTIWTKPSDLPLQAGFAAKLYMPTSKRNVIGMLDGLVNGFAPLTDETYLNLFLYNDQAPLELPNPSSVQFANSVAKEIVSSATKICQEEDPFIRAWGVRLYFNFLTDDTDIDQTLVERLLSDPSGEIRQLVKSQLPAADSVPGLRDDTLNADDGQAKEQDPLTDPANAELVSKRAGLWNAGQKLLKEDKVSEGLASIRGVLDIEQQLYGETHQEVLDTVSYLANHYASQGLNADASAMLKLRYDLLVKKLGQDDADARGAFADYLYFQETANLTDAQRQQLTASDELQKQAVDQSNAKQLDLAIESIRQSIDIKHQLLGLDSIRLLPPLRFYRQLLFNAEKHQEARDVARDVVRIVSSILGADAPVTQTDRSELAYLTQLAGDLEGAIRQLLALQELPTDSANAELMARDARFIAGDLINRNSVSEAVPLLRKSLRLYDQINQHQAAGEVCSVLAQSATQEDSAVAFAWRADSVWRYQKENPYQGLWSNYPILADSMSAAGKYPLELMLRKALVDAMQQGVNEQKVSLLNYAKALSALSGTYLRLGDYVLADETLATCSQVVGAFRDDPFVIDLLSHQASVRGYLGDFGGAEKLLKEAAELSQKPNIYFKERAPFAYRRLGAFYGGQGNQDQALAALELAVNASHDKTSEEYLRALAEIAQVQILARQISPATSTCETGTSILQTANLLPSARIELLLDFSNRWLALNQADQAETLALSAKERALVTFGDESLSYCDALAQLAQIQFSQQKPAVAMGTASEALHTARKVVEQSAYLLSPRQQLAFTQTMRSNLDLYLSIASKDPSAAKDCFAEIFSWKGAAMVRSRAVHQLASQEGVAPFYQQLSAITRQLSNAVRHQQNEPQPKSLSLDPDLAASQARLREQEQVISLLSQTKDLLEGQLSASRLAYMDLGEPPTVKDFVIALPDDGVFIDYFVYEREAVGMEGKRDRVLLASVVSNDGKTTIHDLGEMMPIEQAIGTWRESLGEGNAAIQAGHQLRTQLWDPLEARLADSKTILVSPDDALGQLPIFALPTKDGKRYLIEDHRLAVIAVPQLVPELVQRKPSANSDRLLLVGGVDYDAARDPPAVTQEVSVNGNSSLDLNRAIRNGAKFVELPGTRDEINELQQLFATTNESANTESAVKLLTRSEASESAFRADCGKFATIHIATHGFFAAPIKADVGNTSSSIGLQDFNPGLLSGLAFAGANQAHSVGEDDGVMTADEIATLSLEGVELAVLSACETGLGRVAGGEGLIGIQRSFQVSGAATTIASLWHVPDQATSVLMQRFYHNYWQLKMSRLDALRESQIFLLNTPTAIQNAEPNRGVDRTTTVQTDLNLQRLPPQSWAAFVLSGDWR